MKPINYLGTLLIALMFCLLSVSCEEEAEGNATNPAMTEIVTMIDDAIKNGNVTTSVNTTDCSIVFVAKYQDFLTIQYEATFDTNRTLTSCIQTYTLDSEERASKIYNALDKEIKDEATLRGKVITIDVTSGWEGASYEEYLLFAQNACEMYKQTNPLKEEEYSESNKWTTSLISNSDMIVLTIKHNGSKREEKHIATFENGAFVSYFIIITHTTEALAQQEHNAIIEGIQQSNMPDNLKAEALAHLSISGKTIYQDYSNNFQDWSYNDYLEYFTYLRDQHK